MKTTPLVSIVLTSYNQKPQLERALESLLNQTYQNIEIIIVDDCSTDGESIPFIKDAETRYNRVKSFIQPVNVGIPRNKNTGFKMAIGEYITYLDGDDYYYPYKIEHEIQFLLDNPHFDVAYSNFEYRTESGDFVCLWNENECDMPEGNILKEAITRSFPRFTLFRFELMKRDVLKSINYYDESIIAFHDWDSRIRYSKLFQVGYNNSVCSAYLQDPSGISKRKPRTKLLDEMIRVFDKNTSLIDDLAPGMKAKIICSMLASLRMEKIKLTKSTRWFVFKSIKYLLKHPKHFKYVALAFKDRIETSAIAKRLSIDHS